MCEKYGKKLNLEFKFAFYSISESDVPLMGKGVGVFIKVGWLGLGA